MKVNVSQNTHLDPSEKNSAMDAELRVAPKNDVIGRTTTCCAGDCSSTATSDENKAAVCQPSSHKEYSTANGKAAVKTAENHVERDQNGFERRRTAVECSDGEDDVTYINGNSVICQRSGKCVETNHETTVDRLSHDVETLMIASNRSRAIDDVDGVSDNDDNDDLSNVGGAKSIATTTLVGRGPIGGNPTRYDQTASYGVTAWMNGTSGLVYQRHQAAPQPLDTSQPYLLPASVGDCALASTSSVVRASTVPDNTAHQSLFDPSNNKRKRMPPEPIPSSHGSSYVGVNGSISQQHEVDRTTSTAPARHPSSAEWKPTSLPQSQAMTSAIQTFPGVASEREPILHLQATKFRRNWNVGPQENDELFAAGEFVQPSAYITADFNNTGDSLLDSIIFDTSFAQNGDRALHGPQTTELSSSSHSGHVGGHSIPQQHDDVMSSTLFDDHAGQTLVDDNYFNNVALMLGMPEYQIYPPHDASSNAGVQLSSTGGSNVVPFSTGGGVVAVSSTSLYELLPQVPNKPVCTTSAVRPVVGVVTLNGPSLPTEAGARSVEYVLGVTGSTCNGTTSSISRCSSLSSTMPAADPMLSSTASWQTYGQQRVVPSSASPSPVASPSTDSGIVDMYPHILSPMTAHSAQSNQSEKPVAGFDERSGHYGLSVSDSSCGYTASHGECSVESNLFGTVGLENGLMTYGARVINTWNVDGRPSTGAINSAGPNAATAAAAASNQPTSSWSKGDVRCQPSVSSLSDVTGQLRQSSGSRQSSSTAAIVQSSSAHQCCQTSVSELQTERKLLAMACSRIARLTTDKLLVTDANGNNILHSAIVSQQPYIAEALIYRLDREKLTPSMINQRNRLNSTTPLWLAVITGQPSVVRLLVERKVKVNVTVHEMSSPSTVPTNSKFCAAVHYVAASRAGPAASLAILKELLRAPDLDLRVADSEGRTALHCAVQAHGRKLLMPSPLVDSSINGIKVVDIIDSTEIVRLLISHGANIGLRDLMHQKTALHWAIDGVLANGSSIDLVSNLLDFHQQYVANSKSHQAGPKEVTSTVPGLLVARGNEDDDVNCNLIASSIADCAGCDVVSDAIVHLIAASNSPVINGNVSRHLPIDSKTQTRLIDLLLEKSTVLKQPKTSTDET